ncbi:transcription termination factor 3, mitochondrial [Anopheles maculipalpis]|uniref:transcription termination factor 3, mitochondrial n=1 Tax=Anopheles maculipalpis TaxID=1496333 RepID=UPI002158B01C|nr:transcription termination factor 3, mitochondrial [Anopheles maculipalpis]
MRSILKSIIKVSVSGRSGPLIRRLLCTKAAATVPHPSSALQRYEDDLQDEFHQVLREEQQRSVLDPVPDPTSLEIFPNTKPAFNFAAYVNKSDTLQQLVSLGVELHRLEKRKGIPQFVLGLDFERDMKAHIRFLSDVGVPAETLGEFLTKNPLIFKEDLGDLETRTNYLESKRFLPEEIARIVTNNPFWLMLNTKRIDRRLGYFQKTFHLAGSEVRTLATKQPRLITYNLEHVRKNTFTVQEVMGFEKEEVKQLLLSKPRIWMIKTEALQYRFEYIHRRMKLSHAEILQTPDLLLTRDVRIKQRHGFLKFLGKVQYDPKKELYIPLKSLAVGTDEMFVTEVAKSNMECYNRFLKTL